MRCATSRGCSTKFVVESMTPGIRILSSGMPTSFMSSHSWSWRGLAASMLIACGRALQAMSVVAGRGEVRRVDLQHETGLDDRPVLALDHVREGGQIGILARIVEVDDEARQDAGRG